MFAAAKRVLSPLGVEGASLPTSAPQAQVQEKGKKPKHKKGPSGEPSGFVLIPDDEIATDSEKSKYRRISRSKKQTFKPWKSSWRWPNGTSGIWSREISSFKTNM